jgi:phage/plasmid-like protein (TIGR03299 family)
MMSTETMEWLNNQILIGYTAKRGNAWHYRASLQGQESNHYVGAIPAEEVVQRLFDWRAMESPVFAEKFGESRGVLVEIPGRKAIVHSHTSEILGIHGDGYRIHQYPEWLLTNVERILGGSLAIGSAGLLSGGKRAWVQIEMEENIVSKSMVEFRPFLTAATSLDGSLATTYLSGATVVVCDNTLSAALNAEDPRIRVRHSRNSLGRIDDARKALELVSIVADRFSSQVDALADEIVSAEVWREFVTRFTDPGPNPSDAQRHNQERKISELNQLWRDDPRVAPWSGSSYGVIAAVNTWSHHVQTTRQSERGARNADLAIRGKFDRIDRQTLELLQSIR